MNYWFEVATSISGVCANIKDMKRDDIEFIRDWCEELLKNDA